MVLYHATYLLSLTLLRVYLTKISGKAQHTTILMKTFTLSAWLRLKSRNGLVITKRVILVWVIIKIYVVYIKYFVKFNSYMLNIRKQYLTRTVPWIQYAMINKLQNLLFCFLSTILFINSRFQTDKFKVLFSSKKYK